MKVLLVLSDNIYLTPYLNFYTSLLNEIDCEYKVLYWDKNDNEPTREDNYIRYKYKANNKAGKVKGYIYFRKFILAAIEREHFDVIIPLHSILLFILYDVLKGKYKGCYVIDIRDYSYERFGIFRKIEDVLTKQSIINIVSSRGHFNFLPKGEYYVTHNIPRMNCDEYRQFENPSDRPINLSFIGLIRFMDQNKRIIDFFKSDSRFHVNFIGTNAEYLNAYCNHVNAKNVTLIGTFDASKTLGFYKETDAILNLYGNHTPLLDYALSNKLYYAATLYKPILVCEDTYMEEVSQRCRIGFTLTMKDAEEKDQLYKYITELDRTVFIKSCDRFMRDSIEEDNKTRDELKIRLLRIKK